jgi:hypothetical protein
MLSSCGTRSQSIPIATFGKLCLRMQMYFSMQGILVPFRRPNVANDRDKVRRRLPTDQGDALPAYSLYSNQTRILRDQATGLDGLSVHGRQKDAASGAIPVLP